jgi:hypothetical protein
MHYLAFLHNVQREEGEMHKPANDLMHDITMKVKPCCSTFPMSMVALDSVKPWDLCIVKAHAILSGFVSYCHALWVGLEFFFG